MTDELEPIPPQGALTEREQRLAHGIALVRAGQSYQSAAKDSGIPVRSLWEAAQRSYVDPLTREASLEAAEKRIEAQVTLISEAAGSRVMDSLMDGKEVSKQDAVLYGIAVDKVARIRGLDRNQDRAGSALSTVMERLSELNLEAEVTLRPAPSREHADNTIDVHSDE